MKFIILPLLLFALPASAALSTIQADLAAIGHDVEWSPAPIVISSTASAAVVSNGSDHTIRVFDTGQLVPTVPGVHVLLPPGGVGWAIGVSSSLESLEPLGGTISLIFDPVNAFEFMVVNADDGFNMTLVHQSGGLTIIPLITTAPAGLSSVFNISDVDPIVGANAEFGGDSGLIIYPQVVPEPSSLLLSVFGLGLLGFRRR